MRTKTLLPLLAIAGVMVFTSCQKDDLSPLSKEEATAKLTSASGDFTTVQEEYMSTQGAQIEETLYDLQLPFSDLPKKTQSIDRESFIKNLNQFASGKETFKSNQIEGDFNFTESVGTWEYNPQYPYRWIHTNTPTDKIILKFPHPYNNTTNNVTLTYYDFTAQTVLGGQIMTGLKGKMEIGGVTVWNWVYTATYNSLLDYNFKTVTTVGDFSVVNEIDFSMKTDSWTIDAKFEVNKNNAVVYSTSFIATYTQVTEFLVNIVVNAKIILEDVEFRYKLDFDSNDLENFYNVDPNDILTMSIYTRGGAKIADLKYELNANQNDDQKWVLWVYFTNGEKVLADAVLSNLVEELDSFFWDELFAMKTSK